MVKIGSKLFKRGHYATLFFPVPVHTCPCRDPASSPVTPCVAASAILALRAAHPYPEHEPHPFKPPLLPSPARVELVEQSSSPASIPAAPRHPAPISTRPEPLRLAPNLLHPPRARPCPHPGRIGLRRGGRHYRSAQGLPRRRSPTCGLRFLRVTTQIDCM